MLSLAANVVVVDAVVVVAVDGTSVEEVVSKMSADVVVAIVETLFCGVNVVLDVVASQRESVWKVTSVVVVSRVDTGAPVVEAAVVTEVLPDVPVGPFLTGMSGIFAVTTSVPSLDPVVTWSEIPVVATGACHVVGDVVLLDPVGNMVSMSGSLLLPVGGVVVSAAVGKLVTIFEFGLMSPSAGDAPPDLLGDSVVENESPWSATPNAPLDLLGDAVVETE